MQDARIKSSSAPVDTKPESPSPASSSLGGDKTVCLSAYSQEDGGGLGGAGVLHRLWRWWGGDSPAVFTGWTCQLGVEGRLDPLQAS